MIAFEDDLSDPRQRLPPVAAILFTLTEDAPAGYFPMIGEYSSGDSSSFHTLVDPSMRLITTHLRNDSLMHRFSYLGWLVLTVLLATPVIAQQVAFPSGNGFPIQSGVSSGGQVNLPQTNLTPIAPPTTNFGQPSNGYGQFDPYATTPSPGLGASANPFSPGVAIGPPTVVPPASPYSIQPSPPGGSLFSRIFSQPAGHGTPAQGPSLNAPYYGNAAPGPYDNPNVYGPPTSYAPQPGSLYPSTAYPSSTPSSLFPSGLMNGGMFGSADPSYSAFRLLQGPRLRHAFVSGGSSPTDLQINDTDVSVVFAFPNFLYSNQPVYVVPSFSLHLWDGPEGTTGADLPGSAYSGFLDVGWQSDPNQMFGTELGVRVGAFTDFDTFNSRSIRVLGKALVSFRLTPASTLKAGAYYLDRNKVKLVPAGGILWQPNPYTRFDIFFPQPKLARYWRTIGTRDVWWYVTADYGGGSWTVKRTDQSSDSVDINDIRAILGLEWGTTDAIRAGRRSAFMEVGYVFDREIEYRFNPLDDIKPDDGIMFRAGIGY